MPHLVLQFTQLENLLDEAAGTDRLRVHTLERTRKSSSSALTQLEVAIGVAVQAILPNGRILSWYHEIDAFCSHNRFPIGRIRLDERLLPSRPLSPHLEAGCKPACFDLFGLPAYGAGTSFLVSFSHPCHKHSEISFQFPGLDIWVKALTCHQ
jgi:hypothetical protein